MTTDNSTETPTTAAARAQFERFKGETQSLAPEQVCIELGRHDWQVAQTMSEPDSTGYLVRKEWTLKGLRLHLASENYLQSLLPPEDGETATAQTSMRAVPQNPLVNENPRDTLDYCAHVIAYLRAHVPDPEAVYHVEMGRELIFRLVQEAIEYEANRGLAI